MRFDVEFIASDAHFVDSLPVAPAPLGVGAAPVARLPNGNASKVAARRLARTHHGLESYAVRARHGLDRRHELGLQ